MAEMAKDLWLEGIGKVKLLPKNRLGGGAMGTVFQLDHPSGNLAVKVLHAPTLEMQQKLEFILHKQKYGDILPKNITVPTVAGYDLSRKNIVGYGMTLLPRSSKKVGVLFDDQLRAGAKVNLKQVAGMFLRAQRDLTSIHNSKLVVVDWNRNNLMWTIENSGSLLPLWIDFESWLITGKSFGEPIVLSAEYADPLIWDHVQAKLIDNPKYESDRYSLLYFLFQAIVGFTPYNGSHPKIGLPQERRQKGVWVLDAKVTLPTFGRNVEIFSDELLHLFEGYFTHRQRKEFSDKILSDYYNSLQECSKCGTHFPRNRKLCPECQAISKHQVPQLAYTRTLIQTPGTIMYLNISEGKVYALAREKEQVVLYTRQASKETVRNLLLGNTQAVRFAVSGNNMLGVNVQGTEEVNVWNVENTFPVQKETVTTRAFSGTGDGVFAGNAEGIIHITGRTISIRAPHSQFPDLMVDRQLPVEAVEGQTWFWADPNSDSVLGFNQVFEDQLYWIVQKGLRTSLSIPQADYEHGERINEISVRFTKGSILILRATRIGNEQYIRREVIKTHDAIPKVTLSQKVKLTGLPSGEISRLAFGEVDGQYYIWHPTSNGIVREDIVMGTVEKLDRTEKVVRETDKLIQIGQDKTAGKHFLLQRTNAVIYLSLN